MARDERISEVVAREQARLRNSIRRRVSDPRDAEDVLQDVLCELVEANRQADADRARLGPAGSAWRAIASWICSAAGPRRRQGMRDKFGFGPPEGGTWPR